MRRASLLTCVCAVLSALILPAAGEDTPPRPDLQLGKPSVTTQPKLLIRKAMKDGFGKDELTAPEGQVFLVLRFDASANCKENILYSQQEVGLELDGGKEPIRAHAVTTTAANPKPPGGGKPEIRYQTEIWMTAFIARADLPFHMAFLVPATAKSGVLTIGKTKLDLKW
jgi:hypothetical protein